MVFKRLRRKPAPQTLSSLDAYARWAASYPPEAHNVLMQTEEAAMRAMFPPMNGRVVLDLACGTGRYGRLALEQGAQQVVALDNSADMLRANRLEGRGLATTEAIPLPRQSMDVILCGLALGHLPTLTPSLREIGRVLRPGGCALVSDFHPFLFLNGGRRTFAAPDGKTYAVEHYAHLYAHYHAAGQEAGLRIDAVSEPRLRHDASGTPVVLVMRFYKAP